MHGLRANLHFPLNHCHTLKGWSHMASLLFLNLIHTYQSSTLSLQGQPVMQIGFRILNKFFFYFQSCQLTISQLAWPRYVWLHLTSQTFLSRNRLFSTVTWLASSLLCQKFSIPKAFAGKIRPLVKNDVCQIPDMSKTFSICTIRPLAHCKSCQRKYLNRKHQLWLK